ncbi:MAG: thioredoxin family protein [Bryobacterales bacterium]|nr:thioredoxin family protein [Bryobacterales bacterium]
MSRAIAAPLALAFLAAPGFAQKLNPVQWSLTLEPSSAPPGGQVALRLTAAMDAGWHLYSLTTPRPPIATTISLAKNPAIAGFKVYQPAPVRKLDPNFDTETETFDGKAVFLIVATIAGDAPGGSVELAAGIRYQACDDKQCLPPRRNTVTARLTIDPAAQPARIAIPGGHSEPSSGASSSAQTPAPPPSAAGGEPQPFGTFLLVAFGLGLAAIFTPCVFPMIPITMSFFLKKEAATRRESIVQAGVFALGIIVLFSGLGLLTTAILGPFGVVQLGSNPWVNTFIAAVFLIFGLSLLGAFEITIPSNVLTRLDRASQRGGLLGTLLMGLTFSLTSFACVGPFVGTLLAASVQSGGIQPLLGMAAFATGLASPFFFLALFPALLQRMPKSGGWLARVKVVLGFVILAAMLKYISNVDQVLQWNLLTRERFLSAWVVLFALAGLYLLGLLRMEGVRPEDSLGAGRLLTAAALLIFAISLIPGIFGARLGELDAYVPPPSAGSGLAAPGAAQDLAWMKNQYREALDRAKSENKPVFVNFTGYACTNCHWMKANMFTRPQIATRLKDFVLVELYTDGTDAESEANQKLQESRFSTVAIPYYAILDAGGKTIASFAGLTRDTGEFLAFLNSAPAPDSAAAGF